MLNSNSSRLEMDQMVSIIRNGLTPVKRPRNIVIAGAGMAGLVSASLLKEAGHHVKILEGTERVGGRVHTLRTPFTAGLYMDAGAMRIPAIHRLTLKYIQKFRLPVNRFLNSTPQDIIYVNGVMTRLHHYQDHPGMLGYPLTPFEKGKTAAELLRFAVQPLIELLEHHPGRREWVNHTFDSYSIMDFLRFNPYGRVLSPGAIDMIQVLLDIEGFSELSFLEILLEDIMPIFLNPDLPFYEISGGNDRLPKAFLSQLSGDILFRRKITKIAQDARDVTLHSVHPVTLQPFETTGDFAIITVPFSTLQHVEVEPHDSFSYYKWRAIRELHYSASTKIGLEFKTRFWEKMGLYGGKTITDLPIRFSYYPSHEGSRSSRGVMLASYTWEDDAMPWDSLSGEGRIRQALDNLAAVFGRRVYNEFVTGASFSWLQHPYSAGAFTLFKPGQKTKLFAPAVSPAGKVHFAGEHTSHSPGWIQGAVESGIRAAYEVNERSKRS